VVVIVYGMVSSPDGTFTARRYRLGMTWLLSAAILGTMIWLASATVRALVHDYEKFIAWIAVGGMLLYMVRGQWTVAKALFRHFLHGNYTIKRFSLQFVRLIGFGGQAIHYWFVPTAAAPLFGYDPIFLQAVIGAIGVTGIMVSSLLGLIFSAAARLRGRPAGGSPAMR
jgi:hypothetical protein